MAASTTNTEIANRALILAGSALIDNITATGIREAVLCNAVIDDCRRAVLRLYPWRFARTRNTLVAAATTWADATAYVADDRAASGTTIYKCILAHISSAANDEPGSGTNWATYWEVDGLYTATTTPLFDYTNSFDLPSDCLRVVQVADGRTDYRLEGRAILINADEVDIYYIKDVTTITKWDALFIECMAHYLAWVISPSLTDSATKTRELRNGFDAILPKSRHVDSSEGTHRALSPEDWLGSREGSHQGFVRDPMTG